jgi:hypothetical protein
MVQCPITPTYFMKSEPEISFSTEFCVYMLNIVGLFLNILINTGLEIYQCND